MGKTNAKLSKEETKENADKEAATADGGFLIQNSTAADDKKDVKKEKKTQEKDAKKKEKGEKKEEKKETKTNAKLSKEETKENADKEAATADGAFLIQNSTAADDKTRKERGKEGIERGE